MEMLGGMTGPTVLAATVRPIAKSLSYPCLTISGTRATPRAAVSAFALPEIPPQIPAKNYVFAYDNWQTLVVNIVATIQTVRVCPDQNRAMYRLMADEIRKFEKRVEQQNLMLDYDLYTDEDVLRYKSECEAEIGELTEARQRFRNALKRAVRANDSEKICEYKDEISLLTQRLALMHKHIRICDSIVKDEPELEQKQQQITELASAQEERQQQQMNSRSRGGYAR